ncbi:ArsR family transcriptional regulator [Halorubrum tibetense]|uniref:ArsR family transcriptional regulator n=1 Tax=Halorubrum tibetense TaxID=175631 RepID=A0ABD5S8A4_9EURY
MSNQWDPGGIFEVLASEESRRILAAASVRSLSAKEFERICDASLPTIYRRITVLVEYDMLSEEQVVDTDGNHSKQYATDLQEVNVRVEDGEFTVNLEIRKDTVDKFGELFRDLGEGHRRSVGTDLPDLTSESPTED